MDEAMETHESEMVTKEVEQKEPKVILAVGAKSKQEAEANTTQEAEAKANQEFNSKKGVICSIF
jgi:hypothetical protein